MAWPKWQFCFQSFVVRYFAALFFYFAQATKAIHSLCCSLGRLQCQFIAFAVTVVRKWLAHLVTQDIRATFAPRQSGAFHLRLWTSQFLFQSKLQHYLVAFQFSWVIVVTHFSFEFIPSLFILLPWKILLVYLGFTFEKRRLCIYHNIEIQIG